MKKWWFLMGAVCLGLLMCKQLVETGSITVRSEPSGADVFLDDSLADDKTDCVLQDVSLGMHTVRLEMEGYDTWQSEIELTGDEPDVEIDVELTEVSDSSDVAAYPDQFQETECLVPTSQTDEGAYGVTVENTGDEWDIINIFTENGHAPAFTTEVSDEFGDPLPDTDGDGNPDTDTLQAGESRVVLADVIPADTLPFETIDTCLFTVISSRDTTKLDTAFLITIIRQVEIMLDPDTVVGTVYPGVSTLLDVYAFNTSFYRGDTVNLTWRSNKNPVIWPVEMFGLVDTDGDGNPDVGVPPGQIQTPFQVRMEAPDSALAGDSIIIELVGASANYPYDLDPSTDRYPLELVTDTTVLMVVVEPAADILLRPDYVDSVPAGQSILYLLEVLNFGNGPDVPDITYDDPGRPDWIHRLVAKDMISDLVDTDGDGIPDVGIVPGLIGGVPGVDTFYLEVTPPYTAFPGLADTTILRATSSINDTATDIAIIETITRAGY